MITNNIFLFSIALVFCSFQIFYMVIHFLKSSFIFYVVYLFLKISSGFIT